MNLMIGSHISSAKGYEAMGKQAKKLGANTFAFFTRNPRGGRAKEIVEQDVESFLQIAKEEAFGKIVAHAPYTLNPCAEKEEIRQFARMIFADDLKRMEYTPGNYYNFHPGCHVGQGTEKGIEWVSSMLNECLKSEQTTTVLLETMSGKGTEIGRSFEELGAILDRTQMPEKVGICLDTCHVYAAGYDIVNDVDGVLTEFDRIIGLDKLKALHLNDSKTPFGSHKDLHEKIGEGSIGMAAFERIVKHPIIQKLPLILETPNDDAGWSREICLLREAAEN